MLLGCCDLKEEISSLSYNDYINNELNGVEEIIVVDFWDTRTYKK